MIQSSDEIKRKKQEWEIEIIAFNQKNQKNFNQKNFCTPEAVTLHPLQGTQDTSRPPHTGAESVALTELILKESRLEGTLSGGSKSSS